ncbi:DNA repair protein RecO [Corynebacterium aquilae]|uniref:DNA repair protein RecO n=1 Tax=Corynebacterium aquilae DSM 44791 TaxID=1431546 RepID=A0A1L7CH52_9CORY|nr:DNA repair protein RecO [Corynebacterium aquilae]APT85190.1 DNA recombination protein RecO [Corynebacterium aquilae DSM 44791]
MARPSFRERALVVGSHDFREADRIVVLLTRTRSVVRAVAKGVRRSNSRFGSRLQPFVLLDVQLYEGTNLCSLTGADTVEYLAHGLIEDFERYTAAAAILQAARRYAVADDHDPFLFDSTLAALRRMRDSADPLVDVDEFLLQVMMHEGLAPSLFDCANCGKPGPHHAFVAALGGAVCGNCRPPGMVNVDEQALRLMWLLAHGHREAAQQLLEGSNGQQLAAMMHRMVSQCVSVQVGSPLRALQLGQ